jgi:hypothetical protein
VRWLKVKVFEPLSLSLERAREFVRPLALALAAGPQRNGSVGLRLHD